MAALKIWQFIFLVTVVWNLPPAEASAGVLLSPSISWKSFAFQPLAEEVTPNYYGYGFEFQGGYSFGQVIDLFLYTDYTPGQLKDPGLGQEDAMLFSYGGGMGMRFARAIYLGLRGGTSHYHLVTQKDLAEISGSWKGAGAGASIGAYSKLEKERYLQFTIDYGVSKLAQSDKIDEGKPSQKRAVEYFAVRLAYVFNGLDNFFKNALFRSFMESL